ncbi:acyltransferase family protein [Lentzea indica]|uniref:acyltransferase family protein n=1 Tax=Lentzea indica TaxID=2604800 RepID=UPI00406BB022
MGRAVGALLVFYSHIAAQWVGKRDEKSAFFDTLNAVSSDPFHMSLQGIGEVAVPFFFLVSGFVVTPIALRHGQVRFGLNRLSRVYPPMIFTVLLTALLITVGGGLLATGQSQTISAWTLFTNSVLVNYLIFPQVVLVGVAWTLIVEVIFYVLLILLIPVLRRWVWLALAIELTFVFVVLMSRAQFGKSWSLFAVNVSYLPIPIIGQIIWATTTKRIPLWLGGLYTAGAWSLYVLGDALKLGRVDNSYSLALAIAVLCFLLGLFAEPRLRERKFWIALSERSYSIYLLHGLVAFAMLDLLRPAVPLLPAVVIAVAITFGAVELSYRFVEKPSHKLARKLSKPKLRPAAEEPASESATESAERVADSRAIVTAEVTIEIPRLRAGPRTPASQPTEDDHTQVLPRVPSYPASDPDERPRRRRLEANANGAVSVARLLADQAQKEQKARQNRPTR